MDNNPLPETWEETLGSWSEIFAANPPASLIKMMITARSFGDGRLRIKNYIDKAVKLTIHRAVRYRVRIIQMNRRMDVIEDAIKQIEDKILFLDEDSNEWTNIVFYNQIRFRVADAVNKINKIPNFAEYLPDMHEFRLDNAEHLPKAFRDAIAAMPPALKEAYEELITGKEDPNISCEARKKRKQRLRKHFESHILDSGFATALDEDDDETEIYVDIKDHNPNGAAIAMCLMAFSANFETQPSDADTEKWCAKFPEFASEIRAHAKAMEILAAPDE